MTKNLLIIFILILAFFLRVPFLDRFPAGLNADEAAIGYNDYSLIKTGLDEHGTSWPLVFRSFDDYKPAGYFYLALPFVATMGLSVWAVRLPSALLGVISIYFIYLLSNKLFPQQRSAKSRIVFEVTQPTACHFPLAYPLQPRRLGSQRRFRPDADWSVFSHCFLGKTKIFFTDDDLFCGQPLYLSFSPGGHSLGFSGFSFLLL